MTFFNPFGLFFMILIIIPNIVFAIKCKDGFENISNGKLIKFVEIFEQVGRYGCFICMIFIIPGTNFGFWSDSAFALYLIFNTIFTLAYCLLWIFCFSKNNLFKTISLSVIPSVIFLFSGIMSRYVILIIFALIFAPCHIIISVLNAKK